MFSHNRSFFRRALAANTLFLLALLLVEWLVGALRHPGHPWFEIAFGAFPIICAAYMAIDMARTYAKFRHVRVLFKNPPFFEIYFMRGLTSGYLATGAQLVRELLAEIRSDESLSASLRERCERLIMNGDILKAYDVLERARRGAAKSAKRHAQDEELREHEAQLLIRRGGRAGIPEERIRAEIARGIEFARSLIVRQEDANHLLGESRERGCELAVSELLKAGDDRQARELLIRVRALIEQARPLDVEEHVRALIAAGAYDEAEVALIRARKSSAIAAERMAIQERISALGSPEQKAAAQKVFDELDFGAYDSRPFRKKFYELEQIILGE